MEYHSSTPASEEQEYIATQRGVTLRDDLSPRIDDLLEKQAIASISLVVFDADEIIWAEAFGKANVGQNIKAELETVYTTGSTFKVVMATAIMQLIEAGDINLDDPVNTYLSTPIPDLADQGHPLTIRQMLAHRSGLENPRAFDSTNVWSRSRLPSQAEQISQLRAVSIPGETYEYCNVCFLLSADIIENVSGRDLDAYLRDEILLPIGSKITAPLYPDATMTEWMALPYEQHARKAYPIPQKFLHTLPAGDTYLRPLDMAAFLQTHLDGNDRQLLSQKFIEKMREPQFGGQVTLGFLSSDQNGVQVLEWDGGTIGGSTMYEIEPENGIGIYIASNSHNTHLHLHNIAQRIRDLLRGEDAPFDYVVQSQDGDTPPQLSRNTLQNYVGTYQIENAGVSLSVDILNQGLALTNPTGDRIRLIMLSETEAVLIGTDGERIVFARNDKDDIQTLKLISGGSTFTAIKKQAN